jgi:hypothetical protein
LILFRRIDIEIRMTSPFICIVSASMTEGRPAMVSALAAELVSSRKSAAGRRRIAEEAYTVNAAAGNWREGGRQPLWRNSLSPKLFKSCRQLGRFSRETGGLVWRRIGVNVRAGAMRSAAGWRKKSVAACVNEAMARRNTPAKKAATSSGRVGVVEDQSRIGLSEKNSAADMSMAEAMIEIRSMNRAGVTASPVLARGAVADRIVTGMIHVSMGGGMVVRPKKAGMERAIVKPGNSTDNPKAAAAMNRPMGRVRSTAAAWARKGGCKALPLGKAAAPILAKDQRATAGQTIGSKKTCVID